MDEKRLKHRWVVILAVWLITISCKLSNPMSGLGNALKEMFDSIGRSITIRF